MPTYKRQTHTHTHTYRDTDTDKPMAIGKILQIFLAIKMFDLQQVGQGHGVQFSQLQLSMANVKIYKCLSHIFALALIVS